MKSSIIKLTLGLMLLTGVVSCDKNNLVVDQDALVLPDEAKFVRNPAIPTGGAIGYFISETPAPGSPFTIGVGVSNIASVDRKVKIEYSSLTAVAGTHYTAPSEVTIPAGQALGTLTIQGIFAAYPTGRKDVLKVRIVNADGYVNKAVYQDSFNLTLQKYCTVTLDGVGGDYDHTMEGTYGPYTSTVEDLTLVPGSTTSATGTITNIYDSGIDAVATFDWTDPANFKVIVADQNTGLLYQTRPLFIRTNPAGVSTFSSCDQTITIAFELYTSAGVYDQWTSSMAR